MTEREFYNAVLETAGITDEMTEYATGAIAKLDATNAKKAEAVAAKRAANEPLLAAICDHLTKNGATTAPDIAEIIGVSTQKASALLRSLAAAERVTSEDVKGKGRSIVKQYSIVNND